MTPQTQPDERPFDATVSDSVDDFTPNTPPKRKRGRPTGWRLETNRSAPVIPDVAYVIWRDQPDVDGKPWLVVLEATVDPTRALELLELNRGANVEIVELV